jgi:hypothetical protein
MTTISFREAQNCPECKQQGSVLDRRPIVGGTLVDMQCENEACPWYGTKWLIELDGDSRVQVNEQAYAIATGRSIYKKPTPGFDDMFTRVHQALEGQLAQEKHGGEVPPQ